MLSMIFLSSANRIQKIVKHLCKKAKSYGTAKVSANKGSKKQQELPLPGVELPGLPFALTIWEISNKTKITAHEKSKKAKTPSIDDGHA